MSASEGIAEFIDMKVKGDNTGDWDKIHQCYNKKLWHDLTLALVEHMKKPERDENELTAIYNNFVCTFETKINPVALVEIAEIVTNKMENQTDALVMLKHIQQKVKQNDDAESWCKVLQGQIYLDINDRDAAEKIVHSFDKEEGVTPIQGKIYKLSADYYKSTDQTTKYYRAALLHVACDDSTLNDAALARSLAIAAITSPDIYDVSTLLIHPIMNTLKDRPDEWTFRLLEVVAGGDLNGYNELKHNLKPDPKMDEQIQTKVRILCLIEMAFKCPVTKRVLTFDDIAKETQCAMDQVELLTMKAMAKKMLRGKINEVDKVVNITWVKPRALTREKIGELAEKVNDWCTVVGKVVKETEDNIDQLYN